MASRPFVALCFLWAAIAPATAFAESPLATANNRFAFALHRRLAEQPGNLVVSPFSVGMALSMVSAGARGNTAAQFAQTLHEGVPASEMPAAWAALAEQLSPRPGQVPAPYELAIANGMWIQLGLSIEPAFRDVLEGVFGARLDAADFLSQAGRTTAAESINDWVAAQTRDKIKTLLPPDALEPDTRIVLANAIYFKGAWELSFPRRQTFDQAFRLEGGREVAVPMMHQEATLAHGRSGDVQTLELPYRGSQLSMVLVLPSQGKGLPAVEKAFNEKTLRRWLEELRPEKIQVALPRFRFTFTQRLDKPLQDLDLTDAFDPHKADFAGVTKRARMFISLVQHEACIEVNEEGTLAASATGIGMSIGSAPPRFVADRPFLFLIRDRASGTILFLGRVANPLE